MGGDVVDIDVMIVGGGIAGLWTLAELLRHGHDAHLLETQRLGEGQTIGAQGIIHGGLKYSLKGLLTRSAEAIRDMPERWRASLAGDSAPDLRAAELRGDHCYLWRSGSLRSRLGLLGARVGLRVNPERTTGADVPAPLARCPEVFRLDEQVVDPRSLLRALAAPHADRLLLVEGVEWVVDVPGKVAAIRLARPGGALVVRPRAVVLTAGAGNAALRRQLGLDAAAMQRRPLHMVLLRGPLPWINGHCTDGARTRVTITSTRDVAGRCVWQIGGQIAEDGVGMDPGQLVVRAYEELTEVLPGISLAGAQAATYAVDRAEGATPGGARPEDVWVRREGNVVTAWPTKMALAPRLAERVRELLEPPVANAHGLARPNLHGWPRPELAAPPWEEPRAWIDAP